MKLHSHHIPLNPPLIYPFWTLTPRPPPSFQVPWPTDESAGRLAQSRRRGGGSSSSGRCRHLPRPMDGAMD